MLLRRVDLYDNIPDLLINGYYDPGANEGSAFEELISFHGGLGGDQNRPFVLAPRAWRLDVETIVGAEQLHRLFKRRLDWLARSGESPPIETQNEPVF